MFVLQKISHNLRKNHLQIIYPVKDLYAECINSSHKSNPSKKWEKIQTDTSPKINEWPPSTGDNPAIPKEMQLEPTDTTSQTKTTPGTGEGLETDTEPHGGSRERQAVQPLWKQWAVS